MAKMVGLSRNLKFPWLNQMTSIMAEDLTEEQVKEQLNNYLKFEIESPINVRKTRNILMNIWYYENEYTEILRPTVLSLIERFPDYSLEIHWCMMLAAYPIFADMYRLLGKMSEFQDEITMAQLKKKIFDEWGERPTLYHSIDKLVSTMKVFDVLTCDKPGRYSIKRHRVAREEIISFMVYSAMNVDGSAYYSLQSINSFVYLFPFEYQMGKEMCLQDDRFEMNNFGGELSIALKRK